MKERISATGIIAGAFQEPVEKVKELARPMLSEMSVGKLSYTDCIRQLAASLGKAIPANIEDIWDNLGSKSEDIYMDVIDLIGRLKSKKIKVIVLSNSIEPFAKRNRKYDMYKDFDSCYLSCEIGYRKPQPEAYQYVLDKENLTGPECIFIDDKEKNLVPAMSLKMKVIWAQNTPQIIKDVEDIVNVLG